MFTKVLVANRGEIATRIFRTCSRLGIATVAVHSSADAGALHVRRADESVDLGDGPAAENYLNITRIVEAALRTGAEAVHPGYGFLAENADFAQAVIDAGLVFIGPSPQAIRTMGEKISARAVAVDAGVPLAPGSQGAVTDAAQVVEFGSEFGYPVLVKAAFGGGGRGMRQITRPEDAAEAFTSARREAKAAFGNDEVYCERYLVAARHVEIQVFGDSKGNTVYLLDRDCSVQRRHQKLIEEAPAPGLSDGLRARMGQAAVRLAQQVGYQGAGTVEFLVEGEKFYFLEMNTRIQVEHPVTELITGLDLVELQLRVASGGALPMAQHEVRPSGAAIEVRINAEDPAGGRFLPAPGPLDEIYVPTRDGIRWDSGYESGDAVLPLYDSLIGKLISWAPTRLEAIEMLDQALGELRIEGTSTTAPAARFIISMNDFREMSISTRWLEESVQFPEVFEEAVSRFDVEVGGRYYRIPYFPDGVVALNPTVTERAAGVGTSADPGRGPARGGRAAGRRGATVVDDGLVKAPMQGTIVTVTVAAGDVVEAGVPLFVLEAMKMENPILAPRSGRIDEVLVGPGQSVPAGTILARYLPSEDA